ncbi:MAG: hypothetical protein U0V74_14360 [Chitinophagales bacterium]
MFKRSLLRSIFSVVFAFTVLFTVSVKEVHYLFASHEAHEHCDNHIHPADEHGECAVCKFDIAFFTDAITLIHPQLPQQYFAVKQPAACFTPTTTRLYTKPLRGPPSIA